MVFENKSPAKFKIIRIISQVVSCDPCLSAFYFRLSDPQGNEIRRNVYGAGSIFISPDMVLSADGNLICSIGSVEYPSPSPNDIEYDLHLLKFDSAGNNIADKMYTLKLNNYISSGQIRLYPTTDTSVVITTTEHFLKVNSLLDSTIFVHKDKLFMSFKENRNDLYGFFQSDTISGTVRRFVEYYNSNFDSVKVCYIDSLAPSNLFSPGWAITTIQTDYNGDAYLSLFHYPDFDSIALIKVDTLFHQVWNKYLINSFILATALLIDTGSLLFAGSIDQIIPSNYYGHNFLYRLNKNGDSLNYREFISAGAYPYSEIYDAKSYDGIYLLSGYAKSDTSIQKSFLCKIDTTFNIPTNISNTIKTEYKIFPQPANEIINFVFPSEIKSICIRNIYSQNLFQLENLKENNLTINSSNIKSGVYFITVEYINSSRVTERIEIIH